jgi:transcription antitermination factor NusG
MELAMMNHPWFAIQVKSRHETNVAAHLGGKGYEWFLPLYKSRHRWSDRFKEMEQPLFPGYVFCRLDLLKRLPVLVTPGVILIIGAGKTPLPIDDSEISAVQTAVKSGLSSEPCQFLQIGQKVTINSGPLCGLEGIVAEIRGRQRLILSVTLLRRSIAVQVEGDWVSPLPLNHDLSFDNSTQRPDLRS